MMMMKIERKKKTNFLNPLFPFVSGEKYTQYCTYSDDNHFVFLQRNNNIHKGKNIRIYHHRKSLMFFHFSLLTENRVQSPSRKRKRNNHNLLEFSALH